MTHTRLRMKLRGTPTLSAKTAACLMVVLAAWSLFPSTGHCAQPSREPPVKLPPVIVKAIAPLIKIGEYKMREERYQPAAVAQGDFIYIIGGGTAHETLLDSVERFNVRTGQSEKFATLGIARRAHRAVLIGNRIYVLGGYSLQGFQISANSMVATGAVPGSNPFDVTSDRPYSPFDERANNPNLLPDPEVGDYIKRDLSRLGQGTTSAVSGVEHQALDQSVEVIDLATRKVTHAPEMPDARAQFGCVVRDGKIYVIGGQRPYRHYLTAHTNTVKIFDPATNKWSDGVPMPTPRDSQGVLVDGDVIVVPGGFDGRQPRDEVEVFNPADNLWRILPPLCRPTSAHSLVFLDHYLFLFGDYAFPGELVAYDLRAKLSEIFTLHYTPARHTAAVVHEGKIYVIGGRPYGVSDPLRSIQVFTLRPKQ